MTDQTPLTQVAETKLSTPPQPQDPGAVPNKTSDSFLKARAILRGQAATPAEMLQIAKGLKQEMRFGLARRLLTRASNHENIESDKALKETIVQQLALCSYKDEELPLDDRLDRALKRLEKVADFKTTTNQETLGLLGSIHKRKFEVDTQRKNLERSLHYYMRGYKLGPQGDQGYTGINAAFVLDFLASLEEEELEENQASPTAENRRKEAQEIRKDIVEKVGALIVDPQHEWVADQWWYYATMAEAHFGLKNYDKAVEWITNGRAAAKKVYEWELESCARQLATIARLQLGRDLKNTALDGTPAWNALENAFGTDAVPRTAFAGKIGLALSGGGFRASLYHLGVLAKLAELDVLRNVEVLSCVSGGSIVGAHYYLKVRHLLQTRTESEIDRQTYISLISETIDEFVEGVKKNIRTRVAVNPLKNFRMFWSEEYSRTTRAAELFEKHLFSRVKDGKDS